MYRRRPLRIRRFGSYEPTRPIRKRARRADADDDIGPEPGQEITDDDQCETQHDRHGMRHEPHDIHLKLAGEREENGEMDAEYQKHHRGR